MHCIQCPVCLPQLLGLPAARAAGQRDLQRRWLPLSLLPFRPRSSVPSQAPGPERPGARGRGGGRGGIGRGAGRGPRGGRSGPSRPVPRLFLCHYRRPSRSSSAFPLPPVNERKGTGWPRAASSRPGLQPQVPIPPAPRPAVPSALHHERPGSCVDSGLARAPVPEATVSACPRARPRYLHQHLRPGATLGPLPLRPRPTCSRRAQAKSQAGPKEKRGARLLDVLRAHVAQASAPLGWDWAGSGSRHPRPRRACFL